MAITIDTKNLTDSELTTVIAKTYCHLLLSDQQATLDEMQAEVSQKLPIFLRKLQQEIDFVEYLEKNSKR